MEKINVNSIPSASAAKKVENEVITLRNVRCSNDVVKDIDVSVIPFDSRNNDHVDFAYSYSDMLYRMPSEFRNVSEAAQVYVKLFMVHKVEDETNENSDFYNVINDVRAARTLFNRPVIQKEIQDFFENA